MGVKIFLIVGLLAVLSISIVYSSEILNGNELNIASKTGIDFDDEILLKSRQFTSEKGIPQILKDKITARAPKKTHVLLQFNNMPTKEEKQELKNQGINLIAYIPKNAWFASVESDFPDKLVEFPNIRSAIEIIEEDKLSNAVKNKNYLKNDDETINLSIKFFDDIDLDAASSIIENYGEVIDKFHSTNSIKLVTEEILISDIANDENVQWVNIIDFLPKTHNDGNRQNVGVNTLQTAPYNLNGNGIVTSQWDGGWVDITHDDLQGRVTIGDTGSSTGDHATHVAGTMLGSGILSVNNSGTALQWRGMAPQATVISYLWWNDVTELNSEHDAAINTYNAILSQNSWGYTYTSCGSDCNGGYDSSAGELDKIVRGSKGKKITQIWSAGNNRPSSCDSGSYDCISFPATAKNAITVGATNSDDDSMTSFSSWGPTNDGRLKPEVTAPGCEAGGEGFIKSTLPVDTYGGPGWCGTSMAAPTTSGVVALMYEEYTNKGVYPLPSTIKAILTHTAKDLGNIGPDYSFGYGRINATAAIDAIKNDTENNNVIVEDEIPDQGKADLYEIIIPAGQSQLKVTLVWDDYPATANANPTLVNNLDLVLIAPNGGEYYPWILNPSSPGNAATSGTNTIDNIEQVVVNPQAGTWQVKVKGTSVPQAPQKYSLVSSNTLSKVQFGYLEPYLVDPTSDKNVSKDKFFTFSSGVKCVGGDCGNVSATLDPETEIFYDDSGADFFHSASNYIWAVRFTSPFEPFTVTKAKIQLYNPNSLGSSSHTLRVYEDNSGVPGNILATYNVLITDFFTSWAIIPIDVPITTGDFWIGITAPGDPSGTYMLNDGGGPATGRSYFSSDGVSWTAISGPSRDLMIRAFIVEGLTKGTIPTTPGTTPFYTTTPNPQNKTNLACLQNMQAGDTCNQTWQVNATGDLNTTWKFFTIYESDSTYVEKNQTQKVNITIVEEALPGEFISITLISYPIDFSSKDPNTIDNPGTENSYTVSIGPETTINVDLYQRGDDFIGNPSILGIGNMSWLDSNDPTNSNIMSTIFQDNIPNILNGTNVSVYYWLDIPADQTGGSYNTTIFIKAVETGISP